MPVKPEEIGNRFFVLELALSSPALAIAVTYYTEKQTGLDCAIAKVDLRGPYGLWEWLAALGRPELIDEGHSIMTETDIRSGMRLYAEALERVLPSVLASGPDVTRRLEDNRAARNLRYVPLNPVRARMVATPAEWPWGSYRATAGYETAPSWLEVDWTLDQFDRTDDAAPASCFASSSRDPAMRPARQEFVLRRHLDIYRNDLRPGGREIRRGATPVQGDSFDAREAGRSSNLSAAMIQTSETGRIV